jgi:acetyl esterase/lipase
MEARVPVELHQFPGTFHGFDFAPTKVAQRAAALASSALAAALG